MILIPIGYSSSVRLSSNFFTRTEYMFDVIQVNGTTICVKGTKSLRHDLRTRRAIEIERIGRNPAHLI